MANKQNQTKSYRWLAKYLHAHGHGHESIGVIFHW